MRVRLLISALILNIGWVAQTSVPAATSNHAEQQFDGVWWAATNPAEQYGFLQGLSDCMTWEVHTLNYTETPEQMQERLTQFYARHPKSKRINILEAWPLAYPAAEDTPVAKGGESWGNPHWYLDGNWWTQLREMEQTGFLKGYLWCVRTQTPEPRASYSKSVSFYRQKMNAYIASHPRQRKQAAATTLARFKDADQ